MNEEPPAVSDFSPPPAGGLRFRMLLLAVFLVAVMLALPFAMIGWAAHGYFRERGGASAGQADSPSEEVLDTSSLRAAAEQSADRFFAEVRSESLGESPLPRVKISLSEEGFAQALASARATSVLHPGAVLELAAESSGEAVLLLRENLAEEVFAELLQDAPEMQTRKATDDGLLLIELENRDSDAARQGLELP